MPATELTHPTIPVTSELSMDEMTGFTPEVIHFLESIRWGTQGVLYTFKNYETTLQKIPSPLLFLLRKHGCLMGTRMIVEKLCRYGSKSLKVLYQSMTAVTSEEQGKGYGKLIARYALSRQREILGRRGLTYAYVEEGNDRNLKMLQGMGYQSLGQFHATVFSRLVSKNSPRIFRLHPDHVLEMRKLLENLYADHALQDFNVSLQAGHYWVLMEQGNIRAGVQVDPQNWVIQSIAGPGGAFALHWLPKIPFLRSLFNPRDFRFLKFGNIYFQNGHARAAIELLEALLARYQMKAAMMYWDKRSPAYQQLSASGGFGLLNRLAETPVNVLGHFQGLEDHDITEFSRYPMVISPLDV